MKAYAQLEYHYKDTATIILKEAWLETLGFEPGTPINVECDGGRCYKGSSHKRPDAKVLEIYT